MDNILLVAAIRAELLRLGIVNTLFSDTAIMLTAMKMLNQKVII